MFRKIALALLAIASPLLLALPARAQSALLFGQKHYYSVTFRENGEAIVYARIVLTNNTDKPLSTATFTNGSEKISELTALQMVLPKVCEKYPTIPPSTSITVPTCEKYGDPDYTTTYAYNPDGEQTQYFSLKTDKRDNDFTVTLSQPIEPSKSGALVFAYVSKDYVSSSAFGVKNYAFKTLGAENRQSDTTIAVDVDSGLVLKGVVEDTKGGGIIRPMDGVATLSINSAEGVAVTNKTLDTTIATIGTGGMKLETASGVAPKEQFLIKGSYAKDSWRLYAKVTIIVIAVTLGAIIVLVMLLVLFIKKLLRSSRKHKEDK